MHLLNDEKGTACFESAFSGLLLSERKTFFIFHLPIFNFTFSITCIYFAKFSFCEYFFRMACFSAPPFLS